MLDACFSGTSGGASTEVIEDALVVGQTIENGMDERVVLFVKLPEGRVLSRDFERRIQAEVRARRSPRHVPSRESLSFYSIP